MDINLPGMSGIEALEEIRKNSVYENIPVYALSANAMKNEVLRGKESGFKDYLT
jgi:CheY-like chemotaxis protein